MGSRYNGYLKPWLREIDKMEKAGLLLRVQARTLYNLGVRPLSVEHELKQNLRCGNLQQPKTEEEWTELSEWKQERSIGLIYGQLSRLRQKRTELPPVNSKVPWQQIWTPEKQYLEIEMERL
jgi:hypothetical protein